MSELTDSVKALEKATANAKQELIVNATTEVKKLELERNNLKVEIKKLEAKRVTAQKEYDQISLNAIDRHKDYELALTTHKTNISKFGDLSKRAQGELSIMETSLADKRAEYTNLCEEVDSLEETVNQLKSDKKDVVETIEAEFTQKSELEAAHKNTITELQADTIKATADFEAIKDKLIKSQVLHANKIKELSKEQTDKEGILIKLEEEIIKAKRIVFDLDAKQAKQTKELERFNTYMETEKKKLEARERVIERLEVELDENRRRIDSRNSVMGKL